MPVETFFKVQRTTYDEKEYSVAKEVPRTIFEKQAYTVQKKVPKKVYTKKEFEVKTPITFTKKTPVTTYETRKEVEYIKTPVVTREKRVVNHAHDLDHHHDKANYQY